MDGRRLKAYGAETELPSQAERGRQHMVCPKTVRCDGRQRKTWTRTTWYWVWTL